jgi:hypothetical protein
MRKLLILFLAAAGFWSLGAIGAIGAPVIGAGVPRQSPADNLIQDARLYCYDTHTGRFIHWGACGHGGHHVRHWRHHHHWHWRHWHWRHHWRHHHYWRHHHWWRHHHHWRRWYWWPWWW